MSRDNKTTMGRTSRRINQGASGRRTDAPGAAGGGAVLAAEWRETCLKIVGNTTRQKIESFLSKASPLRRISGERISWACYGIWAQDLIHYQRNYNYNRLKKYPTSWNKELSVITRRSRHFCNLTLEKSPNLLRIVWASKVFNIKFIDFLAAIWSDNQT